MAPKKEKGKEKEKEHDMKMSPKDKKKASSSKITSKDKGKAIVLASTDFPEDLSKEVKKPNKSWNIPIDNKMVLRDSPTEVLCWTRAYTRMIEANLFIQNKVDHIENHLILLTGFGTKDGISFFEFQNSWGNNWGIQGFGKFARKISLPKGEKSLILEYMFPEFHEEGFALRS